MKISNYLLAAYFVDVEKILSRLETLKTDEVEIDFEDEEEIISVSFHLFFKDEFEEGNSFVGNNAGDWKESWFVIGYDEYLGDPIFVDINNNNNYPVLTAEHGMGE